MKSVMLKISKDEMSEMGRHSSVLVSL